MTVAVVGLYHGEQGIERMEIVADLDAARLVVKRWEVQFYAGVIEAWETKPHGAAERVYPMPERTGPRVAAATQRASGPFGPDLPGVEA